MLHFWTKPGTSLSSLPVVFPGMPEGFLSELKQQCNIRINGLTAQPEITLPQPKTQCLGLNICPHSDQKSPPKLVFLYAGMLRADKVHQTQNSLFCWNAAGNPHREIFLDLENFLLEVERAGGH